MEKRSQWLAAVEHEALMGGPVVSQHLAGGGRALRQGHVKGLSKRSSRFAAAGTSLSKNKCIATLIYMMGAELGQE